MEHVYTCSGHKLKIPDIVRSRGVYLFDDEGKRFLDLESGIWCTSVGHHNTRVNKAITQQGGALMHAGFCYSNQVLEEASTSILDVAGFIEGKCVFLCSGSEAVEISRQISKHLTGKHLSMTLHDSYLGAYASVTDRTEGWHIFNWEQCRMCRKNRDCDPACDALRNIPEEISNPI